MNWIDLVLLLGAGVSVLSGILKGAVRTVFSVAGVIVGFLVASRESGAAGAVLARWMPEAVAQACGFLAVFLGITLAFSLGAWLLRKVMAGLSMSWMDRGLGGALGLVRAAAILGVIALAVEGAGLFPARQQSTVFPWALLSGRTLLTIIPEDTLERLQWDSLKDKIPGLFSGKSAEGEVI